MATTIEGRLYRLYREFGAFQLRRNRPHDAADSFALALYYARRLGDEVGVRECRQLISERNPDHIAVQTASTPLFFAQLMMKYPADEVEEALEFANAPALSSYSTRTATAPINVESKPAFPTASPTAAPPLDLDHHHPLPFATATASPPTATVRRAEVRSDDFLLDDAGMLEPPAEDRQRGYRTGPDPIEWAARGAIVVGVLLIGYLARELYPLLAEIKPQSWWTTQAELDNRPFIALDDDPPSQTPEPRREHPAPNAPEADAGATLAVGANSPAALEEDPLPPTPVKIAKKSSGGASQ